jgi:DNA-binding transcriptional MerR regulator
MTVTTDGLSISEVAERTGLSTHTLRYYERAGLLVRPIDRASSSHRRYSAEDLTWVTFLTRLRSTGMPIAQVKEYAELARQGRDTAAARRELLLIHRMRVAAQLEEVQASLAAIDWKIDFYEKEANKI